MMDLTKLILFFGSLIVLIIVAVFGFKACNSFEETTSKLCAETQFQTDAGLVKGEVIQDYGCPEGYREELSKFEDVPQFSHCCVKL